MLDCTDGIVSVRDLASKNGTWVDDHIANRSRTIRRGSKLKLGFSVKSVCRTYFGIEAEYLGYISHDADARKAVRGRRPLVDLSPRSDAANYLGRVARKLVESPSERR